MKSQILFEGKVEVTENGDIYKIKNGVKELATISYTSRKQRYTIFTLQINKKQKTVLCSQGYCRSVYTKSRQ